MARLTPLGGNTYPNLRNMLKAEIGASVTVGVQKDAIYNALLSNMQKWLASEYDWPFLQDRWDTVVGVGAQFSPIPTKAQRNGINTQINFERPVKVELKWNQKWDELDYGIGSEEYNAIDSDLALTSDPVQRWQMAGEQAQSGLSFEVWPLPATPATLRFTAQRALDPLVADADTADLDDILLVLFCAAEIKQNRVAMEKALNRLARLRGVYPNRAARYIVGSAEGIPQIRRAPLKIIAVHG